VRFIDEYRDGPRARRYTKLLARMTTRPWTIMEVCGGQTHAIVRFGIDRVLPPGVEMLHGPGCPVCVTPIELIDRAAAIARMPGVALCSFGDMLRVPGSSVNLQQARAAGGDVRVVYSPLDALRLARENPRLEVVFFAVGFETTAPTTAAAVLQARELGVCNFSLLVAHVLVPPAMEAILDSPGCAVQAFLAAGHVCAVTGYELYEPMARRHSVPIVVTGFEPLDILQGLCMAVRMLERGETGVQNQYSRCVRREGNLPAQRAVLQVFEPCLRPWRGIGPIPEGSLRLREAFAAFDAEQRFPGHAVTAPDAPSECRAGEVLRGRLKPASCAAFATRCRPERPLGAPMVSSEGACAAYYRYARAEEAAA
jgi:hydrogenase expression/formation protein HypD